MAKKNPQSAEKEQQINSPVIDERIRIIFGLFSLLFSLTLCLSFISFFFYMA
jgi:hypothetical protein